MALAYGLVAAVNVIVLGKLELCVFRMLLGLPCPGCGLTHAVIALLHGRLWDSLNYHLLALPLLTTITGAALCHLKFKMPGRIHSAVVFLAGNRGWHKTFFICLCAIYLVRIWLFFPNGPYPMVYCHQNYLEIAILTLRRLFSALSRCLGVP